MKKFAVVNKETRIVENSVIGDNGSVIALIFEDKDIYEETEYTGNIFIGGIYHNNKFMYPKPYESWIIDENKNEWIPPKPYPLDNNQYEWDETIVDWKKVNANV